MGSDVHHYIIADDFIIPPGYEFFYSEGVLRLPCYQPNGKLFQVPPVAPSRAELGLPEGAFVFCCFNGSVKITEPMFSRWMRILAQVPNSVLWFRGSATDDFALRLRVEATARGISPDRLVFLSFRANTEYLACHAHADLFLDTFPYGAHTTASDALRMGVPIVTLAGLSFASRVCGSLSIAAGLPDLVCATPEEYEAKAVSLATNPSEMAAVRNKLAIARPNATLFDAPKLVQHLEQLFETMWQAYATDSLPLPAPDCGVSVPVLPAIPVGGDDILSLASYQRRVELLGPEAVKRRPTATDFVT
jgi:predicted O-linked N-acetylglucosamine transferase (SPINDLY family)